MDLCLGIFVVVALGCALVVWACCKVSGDEAQREEDDFGVRRS